MRLALVAASQLEGGGEGESERAPPGAKYMHSISATMHESTTANILLLVLV